MGKAKRDGNTPEQPTAIGRLAFTPEQPTAIGRLAFTPEQRASFQRMMAEKLEQAAQLDKAAKNIDRYFAIRDGLIPPPWAEKLRQGCGNKTKNQGRSEGSPHQFDCARHLAAERKATGKSP